MQNDTILIIDFGSQVTQLIARRLRDLRIYAEILPSHATDNEAFLAKLKSIKGIILSGSPYSVTDKKAPQIPQAVFDSGLPILGICYGQQLICDQLGGKVMGGNSREFGEADIEILQPSPLFDKVWETGSHQTVWMSHGDHVASLPAGFTPLARSSGAPFAIIADETRHYYGVQFHPEVVHTKNGTYLLEKFARVICDCQANWSMFVYKDRAIKAIQEQVGDGHVICGLSGGVDSSVAAVLIHQAIGDRLHCVFVDTGLMRAGEADQVLSLFSDHYNIHLIHHDASQLFLSSLQGVSDPEEKRKIIGAKFIDIFDQQSAKIGNARFLAQGTLYPDIIESLSSAGGSDVTIKSHHNVGGLPENMDFALVEPLRMLFKDEVRNLGRELDLPEAFINRHPFPGPGLAIRIPGEVTDEKLAILRQADALYLKAITQAGLYDEIWQAFAVLLPVKTVGVMGDSRSYEYVCALRAVTSTDGMTASSYGFDRSFLTKIATDIVNQVKGINRVVYDITSKPPGTIEWE